MKRKNSFSNRYRLAVVLATLFSVPIFQNASFVAAQQTSVQQKNRQVSGVIKDEKGIPLPGVNVLVEGSSVGTITDLDGKYKLNVASEKANLVFSFIGYDSQRISAEGKSSISLSLKPSARNLDEVIVVGYGTQKAKDLTGNISSVSSKDFEKAPVTNAEGLISGKISGVQVLPSSGKPGAGSSFLIRGGASLNASNDPLIVIDNVPVEGWNGGPGMLSQLNPNDIESFTVLKDASASAIYGSRASNGVILIVTKKGIKGKTTVDFTSNFRVQSLRNKADVLTADEYRSVVAGLTPITAPGSANTDWQDMIYHDAMAQDYNLSVSGALGSLPFRASVGYLNQDGILKTGNYERATALLNLNPTLLDKHLKLNINFKGSYENERIADANAIWSAEHFDPTQPVYVDDQTYGGYFQYNQFADNPVLARVYNPLSMLYQVDNRNKIFRSLGNIQADYSFHFLPDLHLNVNAGYDVSQSAWTYNAPANYFPENISGGSVINADPLKKMFNKLFESYLFYSKEVPSAKSRFDITAGYSYNDFSTRINAYPTYTSAGDIKPTSIPQFPYEIQSHSLISYYGRLNYTFNDKYLFTASLRNDGSSRFAEKNRWGLFPSMALAWKIKEESFLKEIKAISMLKLRLGYGVTGQQDGIDNYYHMIRYSTQGADLGYSYGNTSSSTVYVPVYNPDLRWEETATANIGLDFGFVANRISGSIDVYEKNTKDLLNSVTIPLGINFGNSMLKNIGSMVNRGVEMNLKFVPIQTDHINWDLSFNATYNYNKITRISTGNDAGVGLFSDAVIVNTVGYSRNSLYLYHQVYDPSGRPIEDQMVDVNGDGQTNAQDRYISEKSTLPKYLLGFNTNFQFNKWSVGTSLHANLGHYIYFQPQDNTQAITAYRASQNLSRLYLDTQFSHNNQYQGYSDYYLQNASFLKMDNLYVAYNFGKILNSKMTLKMNASVQNVFTITNFKGLDPESNTGYQNAYPIPRTIALGLNLNF